MIGLREQPKCGCGRALSVVTREEDQDRASTYFLATSMATAARRRLMRDFKRMQTDPPEGVNGAPLDNDIMKWHAVIFG